MECVICYDNTKYKTNCGHYVCNDCTDRMIINKELCPYCRQVRTDICNNCMDRNQICVCCIKYLFIDIYSNRWFSLRCRLWRLVEEFYVMEMVKVSIEKEIDEYIKCLIFNQLTTEIEERGNDILYMLSEMNIVIDIDEYINEYNQSIIIDI